MSSDSEDILTENAAWLVWVTQFCFIPGVTAIEFDDLIQEARISLWREHEKLSSFPEPDRSNIARANTKRHLRNLVAPQRHEGLTGSTIPGRTNKREVDRGPSLDAEVLLEPTQDNVDGHDQTSRRIEIRAKISNLDPTDRVFIWLYFWEGYSQVEVGRMLGHRTMPQRWAKTKKKLARELADLAS